MTRAEALQFNYINRKTPITRMKEQHKKAILLNCFLMTETKSRCLLFRNKKKRRNIWFPIPINKQISNLQVKAIEKEMNAAWRLHKFPC